MGENGRYKNANKKKHRNIEYPFFGVYRCVFYP